MRIVSVNPSPDERFYLSLTNERGVAGNGALHVTVDDGCWVIEHIYVSPGARGQGIARGLVDFARTDAGTVVHDHRLSPQGAALVERLGVPGLARLREHGEVLDEAVTEQTGAGLLALLVGNYNNTAKEAVR